MQTNQYVSRVLTENVTTNHQTLDYDNDLVRQRAGTPYTAQPAVQINYGYPQASQHYAQPAYSLSGSVLTVPQTIQNAVPDIIPSSQQTFVLYQGDGDGTGGVSTTSLVTTTIPREYTSGHVHNNGPVGAGSVAVVNEVDQIGRAAGNVIVVRDHPMAVPATVEVHQAEVTSAATSKQASTEGRRAGRQKAARQSLTGETQRAVKAGVQQQKTKTATQKSSKQTSVRKLSLITGKKSKSEAVGTNNASHLEELGDNTAQDRKNSTTQSRKSIVNDIFVEQVQAAKEAQKKRLPKVKQNQQTKTRTRAVQVSVKRAQTAQGASGPRASLSSPGKTQTIGTQTQTGQGESQRDTVVMNAVQIQTETSTATDDGSATTGGDGHVGTDHVIWTASVTPAEEATDKSADVVGEAEGAARDVGDESGSDGDDDSEKSPSAVGADDHVYASVIKPLGSKSAILPEKRDVDSEQIPPLPPKSELAFEKDEADDGNEPSKLDGDEDGDSRQVEDAGAGGESARRDPVEVRATSASSENESGSLGDQDGESQSSRILRVAADRRKRGEIDIYENITPGAPEDDDRARAEERHSAAAPSGGEAAANGVRPKEKTPVSTLPAGFVLNESLSVYFHCCDITKLRTYVIVSADGGKLKHEHGVAHAVAKAGGKDLEKDSKKYVKKNGPVAVGDVISTRPGKLQCAQVFHAVGPKYNDYKDKNECRMKLRQTYDKIFETCMLHRVPSIAIPLISAGRFGVPYQFVASSIYESLLAAAANENSKYPKEVHFVNLESAVILAVAVNLATLPAEIAGKMMTVRTLSKSEVRDVLRERVIHRRPSLPAVKKPKEAKATGDANRPDQGKRRGDSKS